MTPSRTAFVLVSAGLTPKFGPFRLYAQLARRLAEEGFLAMRFDLGGVGDSGQSYPGTPLLHRTGLEIRDALDHLFSSYSIESVILGGLCSGGEDAFRYAERDDRVSGVVLIDPFAYKTAGWWWRHWLYRIAKRTSRYLGLYQPAPLAADPLINYKYMEREESSRILRSLVERNARVHFIYTGGMDRSFNHCRQLVGMFPAVDFRGQVGLDHFPWMEHTQALEEDRQVLIDAVAAAVSLAGRRSQ